MLDQTTHVAVVRVRGLLVLSQRRLMERMAGAPTVQAALARVEPALRVAYEEASVLSWVPQPAVRAVTREVAHAMAISPVTLAERVVSASVKELCDGPWNVLLRMVSDDALIRRAATLFARSFDAGELASRALEDGSLVLTLTGWPDVDEMDRASVAAGMLATLGAVGRSAQVEQRALPDGAIYTVRVM